MSHSIRLGLSTLPLILFCTLAHVSGVIAAVSDDDASGLINPQPSGPFVCESLSLSDLTSKDLFVGIDPVSGIASMERALPDSPELVFALMLLMPVDGWVQSFSGKGGFTATLGIVPGSIDLAPLISDLRNSLDPEQGLSLQSIERFHTELQKAAESQGALLPPEEALEIQGTIERFGAQDGQIRLVVTTERQLIDMETGEVSQSPGYSQKTFSVKFENPPTGHVPILSAFGVERSIPLYRIEPRT